MSRNGFGRGPEALLALILMLAAPALAAQTVELTFSHYLPERHGLHSDFIEPWSRELEERTGGRVKVVVLPGDSPFGDPARQADQVRAGAVDIALGLRGIPRGGLPRSSVIELPFLVEDAGSGSLALWTLYNEGLLGNEYRDFKVLALFTHPGGWFHTRNRPVREPADLPGLRLRSPSPAVSAMLEYLGASPASLDPAQIPENLEKGVLDGLLATWDMVAVTGAHELLRYHTDARVHTLAFYVVMNKARYEALPEDVRQAIDAISGDPLVARFGPWWRQWEARGRAAAEGRDHTLIPLSTAMRDGWRERLEPMIDAYLEGLKAEGVDNARAIYQRARELVVRFSQAQREGAPAAAP